MIYCIVSLKLLRAALYKVEDFKLYKTSGFTKSKKFVKFCLNRFFKSMVFKSIMKKLGGVFVHKLQADFIIDESTSAIL